MCTLWPPADVPLGGFIYTVQMPSKLLLMPYDMLYQGISLYTGFGVHHKAYTVFIVYSKYVHFCGLQNLQKPLTGLLNPVCLYMLA